MIALCSVTVLGILLATIYFYFSKNLDYWKIRNVPHQKPLIFFGNLLDLVFDKDSPGRHIAKLYDRFEAPYFGFFSLNRPYLILKDPNLIKRVLVRDFASFQDRFFVSDEKIDPVMSFGLLGIKSPHWKPLRNKLSPVFTSGKMKMMLHLMKKCGENFCDYIEKNENKDLEIKLITSKYTTDVIATCAFGITANSFVDEASEFIAAGKQLVVRSFIGNLQAISYFFAPSIVKIFKYRFLKKEPVEFLAEVFMETIAEREKTKYTRNDLIDILIALRNQETENDEFKFDKYRMIAQAVVFFLGGYETTSSTIAFTAHELAVNPEIQNRLRTEILDVIDHHGGDLTYEALQDMKYLDMVVSETLRKYPLIPFIQRECLEDYFIPETGLVIEKGTPVMVSQHAMHWDAKYFPNPDKYDPERFNDINKLSITPYVYLPFGEGPRACIGERFGLMSAKLGIIYILKNFIIEKNSNTQDPLILARSPLTTARNGIHATFQKL